MELGSGDVSISYCYFDSCGAQRCGGAICVFAYYPTSVTVSDSEIRNCSAVSLGGGGISCSYNKYSPSLSVSYLTVTDCTAASSYGQAIHIFSCNSFKWDHLCITGTGTLVKSSGRVPTSEELTECPLTCPSSFPASYGS